MIVFHTTYTVRRGDNLIDLDISYHFTPPNEENEGDITGMLLYDENGTFIPTPRELENIEQFIYDRHAFYFKEEQNDTRA